MKNSGQGLVEYALLLVLVAMVVIGAIAITGDGLNQLFGRVGDELALNGSTGEETPNETPVPVDITVRVLLEPETPISNIQIDAFDASENMVGSAISNDSGEGVFSELTEGRYVFRASYAGQSYWSETINIPRQTLTEISIHEQSFNVHVINSQGATLTDVPVYAYNTAEKFTGIEGVTDQNGMVTLTLPDGDYTFRADYRAQVTWSDSVSTPENSSVHIRVPISEFTVRVYRRNGQAVSNVPVYAFTDKGNYTGIKATADQNGMAVLELADGRYQFRADYQGEGYWSETVTSPDVNSASLYVGGFDVTVRVTDTSGNVMPNRMVYVYNEKGVYLNTGKLTDQNGSVVFELNEGSYRFRTSGDDEQDFWSQTVNVSSATSTTIQIQRSGFLVTVTGGDNIEGQRIAVYVFRYPNYQYTGMVKNVDQNGQVTFDINGGRYVFLAYINSRRYVWSDEVKVPSQQSITINIP